MDSGAAIGQSALMFRRKPAKTKSIEGTFPAALLAEAASRPNGWVYEIRPGIDPNGAVPPDAVKGGWKVGPDGRPTGEYTPNPKYRDS